MKFEIQKDDGATVWFALKDANTTIIEPIIEELNKDKNVVFARYVVDHPDLTDPVLEVRVSSGTPAEAIKAAAEKVQAVFKGLQ